VSKLPALKFWIFIYFRSHLKVELISLPTFLEVLMSLLCLI
jgi:hypothetical protein